MIDTTILKIIMNTLEDVEVKGSKNMANLMACIEALDKYIKVLESVKPQENAEETKEESNG